MARIYYIDLSWEGRAVQIDKRGATDATFTFCRTDNCHGARLKDSVERGGLVPAKRGGVILRRTL
jgi:hypothetical protein